MIPYALLKEIGLGKSLKHFNVLDIVFVRSTGLHSEIDYSEGGGLLEPNLLEKTFAILHHCPRLNTRSKQHFGYPGQIFEVNGLSTHI